MSSDVRISKKIDALIMAAQDTIWGTGTYPFSCKQSCALRPRQKSKPNLYWAENEPDA